MRVGVTAVAFQQLPFEEMLNHVVEIGLSAVEIGSGGYPGSHHCPVDELLESQDKREEYVEAITSRGLILSSLSCHYEPLHPNKELAQESDEIFRKSVRLAELLGAPAVNVLSSTPSGSSSQVCSSAFSA